MLEERYDLTGHVDESVRMTRGKPIPAGRESLLQDISTSPTWSGRVGKKKHAPGFGPIAGTASQKSPPRCMSEAE